MNKSNTTLTSQKGMSTLARAKFAPGMLLQHEDLEQLNNYTRDLSRLMFRSLFGCGVICGLVVTSKPECGKLKITVDAGLALSCSGDPIEVPNSVDIWVDLQCHPGVSKSLWVELCGTTKCCAPRTSMCESDDDESKSECTRERDGFEIKVRSERPPCVCGCPEPAKPDPATGEGSENNPDTTFNEREDQDADYCQCVKPDSPCYKDHYAGLCGCHCANCTDCNCKCVLLVRLDRIGDTDKWSTDHSVRRFIRPVLVRDLQPENDKKLFQPPPPEETDTAQDVGGEVRTGGKARKKSARATTIARALGSS